MDVERETLGEETVNGWRDRDGFIGPFRPGTGPRSDPRGVFPTGPSLGSRMPDVSCIDADGKPFDLHEDRGDRPAIFVFFRSAVW